MKAFTLCVLSFILLIGSGAVAQENKPKAIKVWRSQNRQYLHIKFV